MSFVGELCTKVNPKKGIMENAKALLAVILFTGSLIFLSIDEKPAVIDDGQATGITLRADTISEAGIVYVR